MIPNMRAIKILFAVSTFTTCAFHQSVNAQDRAAAARRVLQSEATITGDDELVAQLVHDLTAPEAPDVYGAALKDFQIGADVERTLSESGFATMPQQLAELLPAYERISQAWAAGTITAAAFVDASKAWELLMLARAVLKAVRDALPKSAVSMQDFGGGAVFTVSEVVNGPLALVGMSRILSRIYRNHLGAYPSEQLESFFTQANLPLYAADFHHYGYAQQLGLIAAMRLVEKSPQATADQRNLVAMLWRKSFMETCRQMSGLRRAQQPDGLIRSLEQTWAYALRDLPDFSNNLWVVVEALQLMADEGHAAEDVKAIRDAATALLQEMRTPTIRTTYGYLTAAEMQIADTAANSHLLGHIIRHLNNLTGNGSENRSWRSIGIRTVGRVINTAGFVCSLPKRACATVAAVPVGMLRTAHNAVTSGMNMFGGKRDPLVSPSSCEELIKGFDKLRIPSDPKT